MDKPIRYNPEIHHRRSIRLKRYDYSQPGAYYVTICVQHKICLFGEVLDGEMNLNEAGKMIEKRWQKLAERFSGIELDEYQIMPNHLHAILVLKDKKNLKKNEHEETETVQDKTLGEHKESPFYSAVQWFKTMATNEYIRNVKQHKWPPFDQKLFQRNYWEHIIRNDESYYAIVNYIRNNPANWQ